MLLDVPTWPVGNKKGEDMITTIAAIIVAWLLFAILWKVLKTTLSKALIIAAILVLLKISFGITPLDIWHQLTQFAHTPSQVRN